MPSISDLKAELKQLNAEYAKIKDMPAEKRADFGKELNVKKCRYEWLNVNEHVGFVSHIYGRIRTLRVQ